MFLNVIRAERRQRNKKVGTTGIYKGLMKQKKIDTFNSLENYQISSKTREKNVWAKAYISG